MSVYTSPAVFCDADDCDNGDTSGNYLDTVRQVRAYLRTRGWDCPDMSSLDAVDICPECVS